jgi:hypothetical protein
MSPEQSFGQLIRSFPNLVKLTLDALPGTSCRPRTKLLVKAPALETLELHLSSAIHNLVDHFALDCPQLKQVHISAKNHTTRSVSMIAIPFVAGELGTPWHPAMYPRGAMLHLASVHRQVDIMKRMDDECISVWDAIRYGMLSDRTWVVLAWC